MSAALKGDQAVRKSSAKDLAAGYSTGKRLLDISSCVAFLGLFTRLVISTGRYYVHEETLSPMTIGCFPLMVLLGLLAGDWFSGLAHWGFDTWGALDTPVFGAFIRSFREHHVNQASICDHDFIETNGDSCLATMAVMLPYTFCWSISRTGGFFETPEMFVFALVFAFMLAVTNEVHKQAHERKPSKFIRQLQQWGLILDAKKHRIHHSGEFEHSYCITTGWMNPPLDKIGFWRHFENLITAVTGALPRANDKVMLGE